jgi:hypothetical protein
MGMPMALRQRISIGGPCVERYSTRKKSSDANVNQFIIGRPPGSVTCRYWKFQWVQLEDNRRDIVFRARRCFWGAHPMDAQEALRTIRTLTRIALDTDSMSFQQMPLPTCFGALCKVSWLWLKRYSASSVAYRGKRKLKRDR